ncbi:hypothetical protein WR25_25354 isoform B [Diploscapter pachys]|uniref:SGNH domain-containing protein n=1 Tax=Diploscapter pachys TaxID=2018661 RepID=A0A2A2JRL0_9BILA|nr:hypothetical protein WR25_25354 isoform A [Diploscapter pachys]PAV64272.1 hypothetical protein WR25_25354 isoform B [Diploscapter pachys]
MTVCPFGSPSENDEERSRSIPSPEQAAQNAPNVPNAPSAQNVNTLEIVSRINAVTKQQVILDTGRTNFQFKNVCNYLDKWNNPARGADDVMVECDKAILEAPHVINTMDDKTTEGLKNLFLFDSEFVQTLLHNVHVLMVGDSIMRGLYKDLLTIHNTDFFTPEKTLGEKVEDSHMGDRQIDVLMLSSDRLFNQAREYCVEDCLIQFIFTTRCIRTDLTSKMMDFLLKSPENGDYPDVIVMNSALWDLTRYKDYHFATLNEMTIEKSIHEEYIDRLSMFLRRLRLLRPITKFLWINFPWPQIPQKDRGFLAKADVQGDKKYYSCLVMEGQFRAAQVVRNAGYDVLDLGFYLRNHALQVFRKPDGVHWDRVGTRVMTQLLLGHLAKMFNVDVKPEPDISRKIHGMTTKFTHDRLWRAAANLLQTMDTTTNIGGKRHGNWVERLQVENFGNLESFRKLIFECVLETLQISDGNPSEGHRFGRYQRAASVDARHDSNRACVSGPTAQIRHQALRQHHRQTQPSAQLRGIFQEVLPEGLHREA